MRILIDGMNLSLEQGTGVATYARNLCACIRREGGEVALLYGRNVSRHRIPLMREIAFFNVSENRARSSLRIGMDLVRSLRPMSADAIPETGLVLRREMAARLPEVNSVFNLPSLFQIALAKFEAGLGLLEVVPPEPIDIAHWTYPVPIRIRGARNIYTLHDLVPLRLPYATLDQKSRYYRLVKAVATSADAIATVSEASRADILSMLPVRPERVVNTHQSVALPRAMMETSRAALAAQLRALSGLSDDSATSRRGPLTLTPQGFFLFLGAIEPKKNLNRLIEAHIAADVPEPLVVVGKQAWQFEATMRMMRRAPNVIYLDYLPFAQVLALMRSARAMVFPSLYEGFGLPIVESFLCGTPVVTSDVGATAEVAGDAALLVDPYDVRSIRDALRKISMTGDPDGTLAAELAARGQVRAALFAEEPIARRMAALHAAVAAGPIRAA